MHVGVTERERTIKQCRRNFEHAPCRAKSWHQPSAVGSREAEAQGGPLELLHPSVAWTPLQQPCDPWVIGHSWQISIEPHVGFTTLVEATQVWAHGPCVGTPFWYPLFIWEGGILHPDIIACVPAVHGFPIGRGSSNPFFRAHPICNLEPHCVMH